MTAKTLYRKRPDIAKRVIDEFPPPEKKECWIDKEKREWKMFEAAKRYYRQSPVMGKVEYET